jgi:hypothetical protein
MAITKEQLKKLNKATEEPKPLSLDEMIAKLEGDITKLFDELERAEQAKNNEAAEEIREKLRAFVATLNDLKAASDASNTDQDVE